MHISLKSLSPIDSALLFIAPFYAFVATWFCMRHFSSYSLFSPMPTSPWPQLLQNLTMESLTGLLLPVTVLTPVILIFSALRTAIAWVCLSLGIALVMSTLAQVLAVPPSHYLTPFWGFLIGLFVRAPAVMIWAVLLIAPFRNRKPPRPTRA
jgi:hypothetical protein